MKTANYSATRGARSSRPPFLASRQKTLPVLRFILLFVFTAFMTLPATAQIQRAWVATYNNGITNGTNQAVKMALDSSGNIYVSGLSQNASSNLGYVTIKYAPNGNQLWATRYDSTNHPTAAPAGLVLDRSNNVIVTGSALAVKYDVNGNELWTAPYAGSALAADTNGNVCITGFGTSFDAVKLDPTGSNLWLQTFPSSCGTALAQAVVSDTSGDFYVAGSYPYFCVRSIVDYELLIIKYGSNGNQLWTATYQAPGEPDVKGLTVDSAGDLYAVADFNPDSQKYVTFMYSSGGALEWASSPTLRYPSQSHGLAVDHSLKVLLTGQLNYAYNAPLGTYSYCYETFRLNTNGNLLWTNYYPQPPFGSSVANSVTVDQANNVYVSGYSPGANSSNDIVTIKYDQNGNQIWLQRYHGPGNGDDAGNAIAVDNNGNVYVTGYEATAAGGTEIVTIKYSPVTLQRRSDGTVLLQAQGSPGESFDIQASADLQSWLNLGLVTADTNGLVQFDDTNAAQYNARFYVTSPQ